MFVSDIPDFYFAIKVKPDIFFVIEEVSFKALSTNHTLLRLMKFTNIESIQIIHAILHSAIKQYACIPGFTIMIYILITRRLRDWQNGGLTFANWWFSDLFFWKKMAKTNFIPLTGFTKRPFLPLTGATTTERRLPLTGFFYPWQELIFSLKKLFLTPT